MQKYDFIKKQYTPYTPPQNGHCDRYATEKRDSSVLKVTKEPLPHVDGSFQIKAL